MRRANLHAFLTPITALATAFLIAGCTGGGNGTANPDAAADAAKNAASQGAQAPGQQNVPQDDAQKQAATASVEQAVTTLGTSPSGVKVSYDVKATAGGTSYSLPVTIAYDYPKLAGTATVKGTAGKTWKGFAVDDGETVTGCTLTPTVVCVPLGESQMASAEKYAGSQAVAMLQMTSALAEKSGTDDLAGTGTKTIVGRAAVCGTFTYPYEGGSSQWAVCLDVKTGAPLYVAASASTGESFAATATSFGASSASDFAVPKSTVPTGQNVNADTVDAVKDAASGASSGGGAIADKVGSRLGNRG